MENDINYAAIDIGSNAVRFAYTNQKTKISGANKIRIPLRLGEDVFQKGHIQNSNFEYCRFIFREIARFIDNKKINKLQVYATSALRDANNAQELVDIIYKETKIAISIIDGRNEASLIQKLIDYEFPMEKRNYLLIDIGGGSLELNLYINGKFDRSLSLNAGTVRMLNSNESFEKCLDDIRYETRKFLGSELDQEIEILGTGGNFRQILKIHRSNKSIETYLKKDIKSLTRDILSLPLERRIHHYNLNPDRARVIAPAMLILDYFLSDLKASKLHCCRHGLVHAMLLELME